MRRKRLSAIINQTRFWKRGKNLISFNVPPYVGTEENYIKEVIANRKICGDGEYTKKCHTWLEERTETSKALLTTSCTHALEMAAILTKVGPGDEVILPSYTFDYRFCQ